MGMVRRRSHSDAGMISGKALRARAMKGARAKGAKGELGLGTPGRLKGAAMIPWRR